MAKKSALENACLNAGLLAVESSDAVRVYSTRVAIVEPYDHAKQLERITSGPVLFIGSRAGATKYAKKFAALSETVQHRVVEGGVLGREAFERGANSAPALDPNVKPLLAGLPVGGGGLEILEAWTLNWHTLNARRMSASLREAFA